MVPLEFLLTYSFRSHYGPGVDSASNRNEYQEHFLGVKAAGLTWAEGVRGLMGGNGLMEEDWNDRNNWRKKII
jgi:hypothetical protein